VSYQYSEIDMLFSLKVKKPITTEQGILTVVFEMIIFLCKRLHINTIPSSTWYCHYITYSKQITKLLSPFFFHKKKKTESTRYHLCYHYSRDRSIPISWHNMTRFCHPDFLYSSSKELGFALMHAAKLVLSFRRASHNIALHKKLSEYQEIKPR
jgi:hypothetical protein